MIRYLFAFAVAAGLFAAGLLTAPSPTANAERPNVPLVSLECGAGGSFEVIVNGGRFGVARDTESGKIFVPFAFRNVAGTFTNNEGTVFEFEEEDISHPAPPNKDVLECTFDATFEDDDGTGEVSGEVSVFVVGRR